MKESKIYKYYAFGYNYRVLRYPSVGWSLFSGDEALKNKGFVGLLEDFFTNLEELNLQVTQVAAAKLKETAERVKALPKDSKLDATLCKEFSERIESVDATLDAELNLRTAFIVTPKRIHVEHLLNSPTSLFGNQVFDVLPTVCQFDFREGCRCVAFALPTAAAFHFMRATEGLIRELYCHVIKRKRLKTMLWHPMVEQLKNRRGNPVPKTLLDNLDNIRINFRNPTSHPEARYEMDEIQDLLPITIDVANRIAKLLPKK